MHSHWLAVFAAVACVSCSSSGDASSGAADAPPADANDDVAIGDSSLPGDDSGAVPTDTDTDTGNASTDSAMEAESPVTITDSGACTPYVDVHAGERAACKFAAGSHPTATLGDGSAARAAIQHLIILLHENQSLDHYFGQTGHGIEGFPSTFTNPNAAGAAVQPFHYKANCLCDVPHDHAHIVSEVDRGAMDGFVRTDGMGAFGYYTDADHPFYTWLMTTFSTSDRYFCSALGDTGHNRHFLWHAAGTIGGPIFDEIDAAGVSWTNFYEGGQPLYNDLGGTPPRFATHMRHDPGLSAFYAALRDGTGKSLPQLSIVDQGADEHPPGDLHRGEAATRELVKNVLASPLWAHTALVFTYDEGGGLFDHVPPPPACVAGSAPSETIYDNLGVRVPIAVVSPWSRPGYVSHTTHSHTSITRLIELLYDLPALTPRDANSDALLDMFDFGCAPFSTPPSALPAAGAPGCPATCASGP